MATIPVVNDPGISTWKGTMFLDWMYAPPWMVWDEPECIWDDSKFVWDRGLDSANQFNFDMDYDLNNDGNWESCTLTDGNVASDVDVDALSWQRFMMHWDIQEDVEVESNNCRIRTRIHYDTPDVWSDYGYYGPVAIKLVANPFFTYQGGTTVVFAPDNRPSYPNALFKPKPNFHITVFPNGNFDITETADTAYDYELFYPVLTNAEMADWDTFLVAIDFSKERFLYTTVENNEAEPFKGKVQDRYVKFVSQTRKRLRGSEYWSLQIKMRKTHG